MTSAGGERDKGGGGSPSAAEKKTREARAGETGTTRFGMEDGADTLTDDTEPTEKHEREGDSK